MPDLKGIFCSSDS